MTGSEIKAFVDSLTNDSCGDTFFYHALNVAKDKVEGQRDWSFLKTLQSSQNRASGATVTTSSTLPTDFGSNPTLTVGSETTPRLLISIDDSRALGSASGYWYIDYTAGLYYLTGTEGAGGTIYLRYTKASADLTSATSPLWPSRYHRILGYDVAKQWAYMNGGEKEFDWSREMGNEAKDLMDQMILWDERLKASEANNSPADLTFATVI